MHDYLLEEVMQIVPRGLAFYNILYINKELHREQNMKTLSSILVFVAGWRIFAEESLRRHEFGQAWEDYRRKSWRLLPFVF